MKSTIKIIIVGVATCISASSFAANKLVYDARFDAEKGCYDYDLGSHRRIQLRTADEIQKGVESKDFECTEFSDVVAVSAAIGSDPSHQIFRLGDYPEGFKVVEIKGTGGPLGKAGVFDFNFRGARIVNFFLDYQVAIGGDSMGLAARGVYLGFYAQFRANGCSGGDFGKNPFSIPSYFKLDAGTGGIDLYNKNFGPDTRTFFSLVLCQTN